MHTRALYVKRYGFALLAALLPIFVAPVRAQVGSHLTAAAVSDLQIAYSTVWGDRGQAEANAVATDRNGDTYIAGESDSPDGSQARAFVIKVSPSGVRLYTTYLPNGACDAVANGLAVSASGDAYVVGQAHAPDDTGGCHRTQLFAARLDPHGTVTYNVRYGHSTSDRETAQAVAIDAQGDAYLTGAIALDPTFPTTPGALVPNTGDLNSLGVDLSVVMKLDDIGHLAYSTLLGNLHHWNSNESGMAIAVDVRGDAYVAGKTGSDQFPVTGNAYQTRPRGDGTPYVSELDPIGGHLLYSTYLGGSGASDATGIALDATGHVYVTGETGAMDFPTTPDAYQRLCGTNGSCNASRMCDPGSYDPQNRYCFAGSLDQAFVAEFDPNPALPAARTLVYSTYLGGNVHDGATGITVLSPGRVVVCGFTTSLDFPTLHGVQRQRIGKQNAFATWLDLTRPGRAAILASTYLGGSAADKAKAVASDASGNVYVVGGTTSTDFPRVATAAVPGAARVGSAAAFVTKFGFTNGSGTSDGKTAVPPARGKLTITAVGLLHVVKGQTLATATLRRGEAGTFVVVYATDGAGVPSGHLIITQNGRTIFRAPMTSASSRSGQHYVYDTVTASDAGSYRAHMTLRLGRRSVTRDVPFTVAP